MGSTIMHISACTQCGAQNATVYWRSPRHCGGILVSVLCAACEERIEAAERARQERESAQASREGN